MKKTSVTIVSVSVLITAAVIGGVYYMAVVKNAPETPGQQATTWQTLEPNKSQPAGNAGVAAETANRRTNTPIKCHNPEIGEFWTNAATCGTADLNNRISHAQSITPPEQRKPYGHEDYVSPQEAAERNRAKWRNVNQPPATAPNFRLKGKSPPSGLNATCSFAVGKALELERALSAARDPGTSTRKDEYCRWRKQASNENCHVPGDTYHYNNLCS